LRYDTGSHVDVSGVALMLGAAKKIEALSVGAFFEAGWGSYDSYNSFNAAPTVKGSGDTNYYGGGVLGRYDSPVNVYGEGSLRIGRVENDFSSKDFLGLGDVRYDSSSMYVGTHIGGGYILNLDEKSSLDLSTKLFWTHQGSDDVTIAGDKVEFDAANSVRARLGGRYSYAATPVLTPYGGAYLDYEFDGKSKAKVNGTAVDAPDLKGATGVGELGLTLKPLASAALSIDAGIQGYVGNREGVTGSLRLKYEF